MLESNSQYGGIKNIKGFMELSPKQQAVNEIKNAKHLLILGHRNPDGDQLGSILALKEALEKAQKSVTAIVSEEIPPSYKFLPELSKIKREYKYTDGKILRIDTKRIPVEGMKWRKDEEFLDIHLETEKNLKFEFIEIINGLPKPDLIIIVDTPSVKEIETVYRENEKLFLETPVLNIDHHPGNEYFGTVNLVDLTATSTTEILVSLFESLGIKIDTPDIATSLLTGIISDTQSFRSHNTTPKSLTVAAQLLAAGGRQQEIVNSLYAEKDADKLMTFWRTLVTNTERDEKHRILWSWTEEPGHPETEIEEATRELLAENKGYDLALVFYKTEGAVNVTGIAESIDEAKIDNLAKAFKAQRLKGGLHFSISGTSIDHAQKIVLKKIADSWHLSVGEGRKQLWEVIEQSEPEGTERPVLERQPVTIDVPKSVKEKEDAIEEALKSISQAEKDENRKELESVREVIDRKRASGLPSEKDNMTREDSDIFEDE